MLGSNLSPLAIEGKINDYDIIRLEDGMISNVMNDKKIVVPLKLKVLENPGRIIGNPTPIIFDRFRSISENDNGNGNAYGDDHKAGNDTNNSSTESKSVPTYQPNPTNITSEPRSSGNPYSSHRTGGGSAIPNIRTNVTSSSIGVSAPAPAPIMRTNTGTGPRHCTLISNLNPYQNRWTIMARITNKSDVRHWSNAKGEGQLFSIEMLDSSGIDIRATFFRDAVDKFHPMLECDKVYTFSGGRLKVANQQYNTCKSDFELTFDQNAEIHLQADTNDISHQLYEFMPIAGLEGVEPAAYVDIIGIVRNISTPSTIVSKKSGKELMKCELTVVDDSGAEVICTIWGERAMNGPMEFQNLPVVAFRRARVSDYGGRTLSASGGNCIKVNPQVPEVNRIMNWWQSGGSSGKDVKKMTSSSGGMSRFPEFKDRKTISTIRDENLGCNIPDKPEFVSFKGSITFIKSDREGGAWYPACPNADEPCKNRYKVNQSTDGMWFCEKCNQSYDNCMYRFVFSATISDATSTTWVSFFDDQAKVLLNGLKADELYQTYNDGGGQEAYEAVFKKAQFTDWIFSCKVKQEMVQDEMRIKTSIQSLHKMDYAKEGRSLLNSILAL